MTGLLVGVYASLVLLATLAPPVAVAGSTLATAALFSPLRRRVQRMVEPACVPVWISQSG